MALESGFIRTNIYVQDGRIARITNADLETEKTIDAEGKIVLPGMIDGHVHFMDPSEQDREDFMTGSSAAASGGVTTVIEHTHSSPVRNVEEFVRKRDYLKNRSLIDFGLTAHVWGTNTEDLPDLWENGIMLFKLFTADTHGVPGMDNAGILNAFRKISSFGGLVLCHSEDHSILAGNEKDLKKNGYDQNDILFHWRSREAELVSVNTVGLLAKLTGVRAIIAHASTRESVDLANSWKNDGADLHIESCPQYFYLGEKEVLDKGAFRKFTPPARIRIDAERSKMWDALLSGGITHISTDHAPSTSAQKRKSIWEAPFGLPGVETTLSMLLNAVNQGRISLETVVKATATTPSRLYGLYPRKGTISVGSDADLIIVDMEKERKITSESVKSKAGWTPYDGMSIKGVPVTTISRGETVFADGEVRGKPGRGRFIPGPGFRTS